MNQYRIEWKWALIFAATSLAWALIGKLFGFDEQRIQYAQIFNTFIMVPTLIIYMLSVVDKRDRYFNGQISFKRAMISGIILSLLITVVGSFTTIISTQLISPNLFTNNIQYYTEQKLMTPAEAVRQFNLKTYIVTGLIAGPLMGVALSLIAAAVVKKNKIN